MIAQDEFRAVVRNLKSLLVLLLCVAPSHLVADYKDPVFLEAIRLDSVRYSLTLDIDWAGGRLVSVGERGHILYSDDGGQSWTQATVPTRMQLNAVHFIDDKTGFAVGEDEVIVKTTDAGENWALIYEGIDAEIKGPLLDIHFSDAENGLAVGVFNKILRTQDGGSSWQPWQAHIDNLDEWHLIAIAAVKNHLFITSEMGLIFRSDDGGETFDAVQTDHDGSFHGIAARENGQGEIELVLVGVGGMLWTSRDGGESWDQLDTDTEAGLAAAAWMEDGSAVIVGADGIVLSLDQLLQAVNKFQTDSGLPLSNVLPLSENELLMVGFGGYHTFKLPE